jgi:hypothetical protein
MNKQNTLAALAMIGAWGSLRPTEIHDRAFAPPEPGRPHKLKRKAKMQKASRKRNRKK